MEEGFATGYRNARYSNYVRITRWMEGHENIVQLGAAVAMALVTALLAQVRILTPLTPVPYTGQVLGIALTGGLLGRKWGTVSASIYVGLGIIGLPVFAGEMATFESFDAFSGWAAVTGLTGGYILGFIAQAHIIGWAADRRTQTTNRRLVTWAAGAGLGLAAFILLDAYALAQAASTNYYNNTVQALFLGVLVAGEIVVIAGVAWLALTSKARRERIELFMANVVGLFVLYAVGALVFALVAGAPDAMTLLRWTVLPFIPADVLKILIAIGLLTLVRPTHREIAARSRPEAAPTDV